MSLFKKRAQSRKSQLAETPAEKSAANTKTVAKTAEKSAPLKPSWELWYATFKAVATDANSRLHLQGSNENIVDFMDHQPLKDAFERGVDATELGAKFAQDFDVGAFLRANGIFK